MVLVIVMIQDSQSFWFDKSVLFGGVNCVIDSVKCGLKCKKTATDCAAECLNALQECKSNHKQKRNELERMMQEMENSQ